MRTLSKVVFTRGHEGFGYVELDEFGNVTALYDAEGSEFPEMPDCHWDYVEMVGSFAVEDPQASHDRFWGSDLVPGGVLPRTTPTTPRTTPANSRSLPTYRPTPATPPSSAVPVHRTPSGSRPGLSREQAAPAVAVASGSGLSKAQAATTREMEGDASAPRNSRFWRAALASNLIDRASLETCWQSIPPDKRLPVEAAERRLARQVVLAGKLTVWQSQQLLAGRHEGFIIDRYVLLDRIGEGGMGRVYLARDSKLGRKVAIKVLSSERNGVPRAIARFLREARVGAQLEQENLVRIYDDGECDGQRYIVMEYVEGKNVGQMIREEGRLAFKVAARIVGQVALGLEHAREKGLIHRDVTPYNILVTQTGVAKLTDMGLAIVLEDAGQVTRDGVTVGTFDYLSPEQAKDSRGVDTRSDIYSLGCSLYHMVCGAVPFPVPSQTEKLYAHLMSEPKRPREVAPDVPIELEAVILKMMRKKPEDRYQIPLEVANALEPFHA